MRKGGRSLRACLVRHRADHLRDVAGAVEDDRERRRARLQRGDDVAADLLDLLHLELGEEGLGVLAVGEVAVVIGRLWKWMESGGGNEPWLSRYGEALEAEENKGGKAWGLSVSEEEWSEARLEAGEGAGSVLPDLRRPVAQALAHRLRELVQDVAVELRLGVEVLEAAGEEAGRAEAHRLVRGLAEGDERLNHPLEEGVGSLLPALLALDAESDDELDEPVGLGDALQEGKNRISNMTAQCHKTRDSRHSHLLREENVRQVLPELLEESVGVILLPDADEPNVPLVHGGRARALCERVAYGDTRGRHGWRVRAVLAPSCEFQRAFHFRDVFAGAGCGPTPENPNRWRHAPVASRREATLPPTRWLNTAETRTPLAHINRRTTPVASDLAACQP